MGLLDNTAINGQVKFFNPSAAAKRKGGSATATSKSECADFILSMNRQTRWESQGSDDSTTETITVTLPSATSIDRIFLVDHNFKEFTIRGCSDTANLLSSDLFQLVSSDGFDLLVSTGAVVCSDFTNVVGIDGALPGGISETNFSQNTAYYEFDPTTVDSIEITVTTTQVPDQEKYLHIFIATDQVGQFKGYPDVRPSFTRNEVSAKTRNGSSLVQKGFETFACRLRMRNYTFQNDVDLYRELLDREESVLMWLCGGKYGFPSFNATQLGWRLEDIFLVQTIRAMETPYRSNLYNTQPNSTLNFIETLV